MRTLYLSPGRVVERLQSGRKAAMHSESRGFNYTKGMLHGYAFGYQNQKPDTEKLRHYHKRAICFSSTMIILMMPWTDISEKRRISPYKFLAPCLSVGFIKFTNQWKKPDFRDKHNFCLLSIFKEANIYINFDSF